MPKSVTVVQDGLCIPCSVSAFSLFGSLKFSIKRLFSGYMLAGRTEGYKRNSVPKCKYLL